MIVGFETYTFFCNGASDSGSLHFTLGVDDDTSVVLQRKRSSQILELKKGGQISVPQSTGRRHPFGAMLSVGGRRQRA